MGERDPTFPKLVELSPGRGEVPAAVLRGRQLGKRAGGRPKKPDPRQQEMFGDGARE